MVLNLVAQSAPGVVDEGALRAGVRLRRDLGFDSLKLVGLLFELAERLGVDPDDLLETMSDAPIDTVGDLVSLGARIQRGGPSA
jgi:acyl carrier protein